jgi:5-methylcytosine-specific restriction enzyme A
MGDLVSSIEEVIKNIDTLFRYGQSTNKAERAFHNKRIKNGKLFVVVQSDEEYRFAPSKFAGYAENDLDHAELLSQRDGRVTNRMLSELAGDPLEPGDDRYEEIDQHFLNYCQSKNIDPSRHHRVRRYWQLENGTPIFSPDEIIADGIWEGAKNSILVNRFERSNAARALCLQHYGYACSACEVILEDVYGELAKQFIHVHHVVPLSTIGDGYQVDPIKDLRPVCPNCHAMLHRHRVALSVEELKELLRKKA